MKTTKSASLKIRKKVPVRAALVCRPRSTSLSIRINSAKDITTNNKLEDVMSKSVGSWDREMDWNTLKSTSLIFEMIRKASKAGQIGDSDKIGKVKEMVIKIENSIPSTSNPNAEAPGNTEPTEKSSAEADVNEQQQQQQQPSTSTITDSDLCKSDAQETIKVSASTSQEILLRNIESKDQGDGLIQHREEINLQSIRGKRESSVEQPTECQEITVADQTIEKRSENRPKRVRRASFELKRMMFEQIQSRHGFQRHDSVESALRHFDSIGTEPVPTSVPDNSEIDRSTFRLCSKDAIKKNNGGETRRGFERHTSAWSIRTLKDSAYKHVKTPTVATKRAYRRRKTTSSGKKLLEARDSIELARVPVKTKLPACRRKILLVSNSRPSAENDDTTPVKSQSFRSREGRVARLKCIFTKEQSPKNHDFSPSTTRSSSHSKAKKNVTPYPSSKSPDNLSEVPARISYIILYCLSLLFAVDILILIWFCFRNER